MSEKSTKIDHFRAFDRFETEFLQELGARTRHYNGSPYCTIFDENGNKRRYIRKIVRFRTAQDLAWYNESYAELMRLMKIWLGDKWKSAFDRHPVFYENVNQINITTNEAFSSSKVLAGDRLKIARTGKIGGLLGHALNKDDLRKMCQNLTDYDPMIEKNEDKDGREYLLLTIACDKIYEKFARQENVEMGTFSVQARRKSGFQYIARVRFGDNDLVRKKFGFIILSHNESCQISLTTKQSERKHKAINTRKAMEINGLNDITFFMKAD